MRTFSPVLLATLLSMLCATKAEAAEFKILEIKQEQVDALGLRGRRTARSYTYKLSADGSHVVGNTADVWWLWTDQEGFNFPYLHDSWLILDVSHNGDQLLLAEKPVDTKVSPHGISSRYAFLFDETQTGYRSDGTQRLKPMQRKVEGKIVWLRSKGGNPSVQGRYLMGVQASALSANGEWVVGGAVRGRSSTAQTDAFRWSQAGGYELLPRPAGVSATTSMLALHSSEDGHVITGRIADEAQTEPFGATHKMFVWFEEGNRTVLVDHLFPEEDPPRTRGIWVSGDGKTIIGRADQNMAREGRRPRSLNRPFTWSENGGVKVLDRPWDGTDSGGISAISHDGSIMVGHLVRYATDPDTRPPFTRSGIVWQNGKASSAKSFFEQTWFGHQCLANYERD